MLEVHDAADGFGVAEVVGLDPAARTDGEGERLRDLLAHAGVLCLRMPRALEDAELQAIAGLFGPIKDPVGRTKAGGTFRYAEPRQVIDAGFVLTDELRTKLGDLQFGGLDDDRPGLFETFHCDDTYTERPARVTALHARALPASGGGPTCFLDMRAAHALLDPDTQRRIGALHVVYAFDNEDAFPPRRSCKGEGEALVDVVHPLVRTHPLAGTRALFLDLDRAKHVVELSVGEGRALLQSLQDHAEANAPGCEHAWRDHDVLVWDNASVQHKARGDFAKGEQRRFWRYMIEGERPV